MEWEPRDEPHAAESERWEDPIELLQDMTRRIWDASRRYRSLGEQGGKEAGAASWLDCAGAVYEAELRAAGGAPGAAQGGLEFSLMFVLGWVLGAA